MRNVSHFFFHLLHSSPFFGTLPLCNHFHETNIQRIFTIIVHQQKGIESTWVLGGSLPLTFQNLHNMPGSRKSSVIFSRSSNMNALTESQILPGSRSIFESNMHLLPGFHIVSSNQSDGRGFFWPIILRRRDIRSFQIRKKIPEIVEKIKIQNISRLGTIAPNGLERNFSLRVLWFVQWVPKNLSRHIKIQKSEDHIKVDRSPIFERYRKLLQKVFASGLLSMSTESRLLDSLCSTISEITRFTSLLLRTEKIITIKQELGSSMNGFSVLSIRE